MAARTPKQPEGKKADAGKSGTAKAGNAKTGSTKVGTATSAPAKAGGGKDDLEARFHAAAKAAKQASKRPSDQALLKLYAYYKQATEGDVSGAAPSFLDFVGRAKFDAWTKLKGMSADDAMAGYIKEVEKLDRQ